MSNLIDERDERTRKRKKIKRKMDSIIGLSYHDKEKQVMNLSVSTMGEGSIRLLDEGYFDGGFVIKKGTLAKYLNGENQYVRGYELGDDGWQLTDVLNLTDDFIGTVNVGHQDFVTYPIIVGQWNKSDLTLVDIENDRKGIDIALNINEDLNVIQDLKAMPYDIGVSAEFYYHVNDIDTEALSETFGMYTPVIDEIFIFAYGLVGECGNVNSSGLELKGATMSKSIEKNLAVDEVDVNVDVEGAEDAAAEIKEIDDTIDASVEAPDLEGTEADEVKAAEEGADDTPNDDVSDDPAEEDEPDEGEPQDDESNEGETDDVDDEIDNEDEADEAELSYDELLEQFVALKAEVERLKDIEAKYAALKKSNRRLNRKLAEEKEAKAEFFAKTKNLSTDLFENEGEAEKEEEAKAKRLASEKNYYKGDGIAD